MSDLLSQPKQWLVVYTKPRNEKKVADRLAKQGFETYCPTYTTLRQWSDRKKKVTLPALPSYVFVYIAEKDRYKVLQDPGVLNFVFWLKKPAVVKKEEIHRLKQLLDGIETADSVEVSSWKEGDEVILDSGPFKGWTGNIKHVNKGVAAVILQSLGLVIKVKPSDVAKAP